MKTLTGSEKQTAWANQIRETVLKYLQIEKAAVNKKYQAQLAADPEDVDEEVKPLRMKLQRIAVVEKFLNEQTESVFFIDNLKTFASYKTFEKFITSQRTELTAEQATILYRIDNEQLASSCYLLVESVVKDAMKEANFFTAARSVLI
jgi:hypothetical protein